MATPTELYINAELPKRPYTAQYPLTPGHVPVATGVGLEVSARQLDVTDVANAASEQYVNDAIDALVDGAPAALDTLNELAAAINDDENYASTVTTALGNRLRVDVDTQGLSATEQQNGLTNLGVTEVITGASIDGSGLITLAKNGTNPDDTIQVPTAVDSLSFNATTGEMTIGYTNGVADSTITVASNEVTDTVFRIKDTGDSTKKIAFEAGNITTATTRLITMPNVDVNLGDDYINASYSVVNGYLSLHRRKGPPSTDILLNPNITIIYDNTTIVGGTTYAIGQLILGLAYPLVANITLTLSTATKPIKIYVGNYKGTITFAGGFVWTPEGASVASFYPTPGSVLEFLPGENDFLGPNWILFEQQANIKEAADFKLIKNNDQDKTVTFNLSSITGNKIITMPDGSVNLGTIPVIHSANGNSVTGTYAAITSGLTNTASGQYSSVLNGTLNTAAGKHATILSGQSNTANIDQTILSGRNITGIITTGAVIHGGIVEGTYGDALGTTVAQYTLRGGVAPAATNWILANGSTNAAVSASVTTATSIKGALSTTTNPDIVNAVGIHDITFMILGSSGSPKPMLAGQRRAMVYYDGTTYTLDTVQTIGTDHSFGGVTSTFTVGLTPSAPFGLLTFQVTNNEAANIAVNISVKSTYNNYQ